MKKSLSVAGILIVAVLIGGCTTPLAGKNMADTIQAITSIPTETIAPVVIPPVPSINATPVSPSGSVSIISSTPSSNPTETPGTMMNKTPAAADSRVSYIPKQVYVEYNRDIPIDQRSKIYSELNTEIGGIIMDTSASLQRILLPDEVSVESAIAFYEKNSSVVKVMRVVNQSSYLYSGT